MEQRYFKLLPNKNLGVVNFWIFFIKKHLIQYLKNARFWLRLRLSMSFCIHAGSSNEQSNARINVSANLKSKSKQDFYESAAQIRLLFKGGGG
jgi:hypothetical protein